MNREKNKIPKGFKDFLIKSVIFIFLFILTQLITMGWASETFLPGEIKPLAMDDLAQSAFFMIIIFLALNKKKLLKIKKYSVKLWQRVISGIIIIGLFPLYFQYKTYMVANIEVVKDFLYIFTSIEYLILFVILFFLLVFVFGFNFVKDFVKEYKKGLIFVLIGTIFVYILIRQFQNLWPYFSNFVASSVHFLLSLIGNSNLNFSGNLPILMFKDFTVKIAKTCSGIDSVFIFTGLFLAILAWDYKKLNKKKMAYLFIPGVIGAFFLNILRVFILILIGSYISRNFALQTFHTNASAVLFLIYFAIFWKLSYKWVEK